MTKREAIIKALLARGEHEVQSRGSRFRQFTRRFKANRTNFSETGDLVPTQRPWFWFVSVRGSSLRLGENVTHSFKAMEAARDALVKEGKGIK